MKNGEEQKWQCNSLCPDTETSLGCPFCFAVILLISVENQLSLNLVSQQQSTKGCPSPQLSAAFMWASPLNI